MPKLTIDGKEVEVVRLASLTHHTLERRTILSEVAKRLSRRISKDI